MTPDPEDTADNLPIDPRLANLKKGKPFKKGFDVRRNLRGVPKGTAEFRTHMRKIAAELIGKDETEMTRYEAMCRMFFTSRNPAHNKLALQVLDPNILTERHELTGADGKDLIQKGYIGFTPDEWDKANKKDE